MIVIEAPVIVFVEAKQADLKTGIGQRFSVGWGRVFEIVDYRQLLLANPSTTRFLSGVEGQGIARPYRNYV